MLVVALRRVWVANLCLLATALGVAGCSDKPPRPPVAASQAVAVPDVLTDGPDSMANCSGLRTHFAERQPALLRGAYRSTVAGVSAWELGGRFPAAVPQFLEARPPDTVLYVCFIDVDVAKGNRTVWLIDASSDATWLLMSGYHDTPGYKDLPVEAVS